MLSNISFKFVTVTFYTIVKSSSLVWILLWALFFKIERPNWAMAITVVVIRLVYKILYIFYSTSKQLHHLFTCTELSTFPTI